MSWRQSPVFTERPITIPQLADNDMNSWATVVAGDPPASASRTGWVIMTSHLALTDAMTKNGATIKFSAISGLADIVVNGQTLGQKTISDAGPFEVKITPESSDLDFGLILQCTEGQAVGLPGPVFIDA